MRSPAYVQQHDLKVQSRVRRRYARECGELAAHGFEELCFYSEQLGPYTGLLYFPMALLMLFKGEVLGGHGRFEVGGSYVLMYHRHPSAIALPLGLGTKLYTGFTDGTLIISASFASCLQPSGGTVVKHASKLPLDEAWRQHQQRVAAAEAQGKQVRPAFDFERYVEMSRQEDAASSCSPVSCQLPAQGAPTT
jgi:hypothetical protein